MEPEIYGSADVADVRKVKEERIADDKLYAKAKTNEQLRRAGTHVYHEEHGIMTIEEAEAHLDETPKKLRDRERKRFLGDPDTGKVRRWEGGRVEVPSSSSSSDEGDSQDEPRVAPAVTAPPAPPQAPALTRDDLVEAIRAALAPPSAPPAGK